MENINKVKSYIEIYPVEAVDSIPFQQWISKKKKQLACDALPDNYLQPATLPLQDNHLSMKRPNGVMSVVDCTISQPDSSLVSSPEQKSALLERRSTLWRQPIMENALARPSSTPESAVPPLEENSVCIQPSVPQEKGTDPQPIVATQLFAEVFSSPVGLSPQRPAAEKSKPLAQQPNRLQPSLILGAEQNRLEVNYVFQRWSGEHSVNVTMPLPNSQERTLRLLPSDGHSAEILSKHLNQLSGFSPRLLDPQQDEDRHPQRQFLPQQDEEQE